jgi:hypothetical protein
MEVGKVVRIEHTPDGAKVYRLRSSWGQCLYMMGSFKKGWLVRLIGANGASQTTWSSETTDAVKHAARFLVAVLWKSGPPPPVRFVRQIVETEHDIARKYFVLPIGTVVVHSRRSPTRGPHVNEVALQICKTGDIRRYFLQIGGKIGSSVDVLDSLPF